MQANGLSLMLAIFLLCGLPINSSAQQISSTRQQSAVDGVFSKFIGPREPGCAVLVIRNDLVEVRKGYGVKDLRTYEPITGRTNFRLASLTKQFTATAVMLLVKDRKLNYDQPLTSVFPDFPAYGKAITIRQLLNHTSGLIDYEDILDKKYAGIPDEKRPQIEDAEVLELLKKESTMKFAPGARWAYSNSGYVILAMVVEKISGQSFGDFLDRRIFQPLGMTRTIAYEKGKNEVSDRAYGHTKTLDGWRETDQSSTSATLGDGGIYTSLDDLEKWDRALAEHTLLSAKEMEPALTPSQFHGERMQQPDGSPAPLYGFGWFLDPYHGLRRYSHYGETMGFRNAIQRFPDQHLTVVVLCNRTDHDAPPLAESVADIYLGK